MKKLFAFAIHNILFICVEFVFNVSRVCENNIL